MSAARRVADATRFQPNVRSPPQNGGETPQQRVARMREAARRARQNQITTADKVIHHGRILADKLHRGFVYGIMGFSAVTAVFLGHTVYGILTKARENKQEYYDFVTEERKKFEETWRKTQVGHLMNSGLDEATAIEAFEAIEAARKSRDTTWGKFKAWSKGGLTPAEEEYASEYELQEERMKKFVLGTLRHDRVERLQQTDPEQAAMLAHRSGLTVDSASSNAKETSPLITDSDAVHGNTTKEDSPIVSEAKKSKSWFGSWFNKS